MDSERTAMVVTVPEAARLLGISRTHVYDSSPGASSTHLRLGRRIVMPKHSIETLLGLAPELRSVS